jgi:hypothetical protein
VTTRYVNPDSNGGDGTTNATSGANAAYVSLSAAEAGVAATLTDTWEIICATGGTADTSAVTFSGITTTATYYLTVTTEAASKASMPWSTSKYRLEVSNATAVTLSVLYIHLDGLQIAKTSSSANGQACINGGTIATSANEAWLSNLLLKQAGNGSFNEPCIRNTDADRVLYAWNCVCYGGGAAASGSSAAAACEAGTVYLYNCTLIGNHTGLRVSSGVTVTAKNCYARGTSAAYSVAGTLNLTTCASSDTTGTVGLQSIALNTTNFTNVTGGSEDFHLPSGSALIGVGTDTSGEAAPRNFTTDMDAVTRTTVWDIGAFEYVAGGPTIHTGSFTLSGTGTLALTGTAAYLGVLAMDGTGSLAGTGVRVTSGALAMTGTSDLDITASRIATGQITMSALGSLIVTATMITKGVVTMIGTGTMHVRTATGRLWHRLIEYFWGEAPIRLFPPDKVGG